MLFSSITFIYVFLPVTLIAYYSVPKKLKNSVLLIASLFFYFFGEPIYTVLLIFSSVSDYIHSLYIERHRGEKSAKIVLLSSIIINLGMLGFFKYADFFITNINSLCKLSIPVLNIPLPIGISFFTFQTMSYTIDVYRGKAHAQKNFISFSTFVCMFPQLVAGPIVRYTDINNELQERMHSSENLASGITRFTVGLGKKVIIANAMGEICTKFRASDDLSVLFYWMYAAAFTFQIYFDFSGYSDMAVGLGKMFGFKFPENFNYPYIAKSITDFWRRWHMTLSGWFRDYVYIPLGGNRVSKIKLIRNLLIVWILTGFWHGASWNFVVWGLYFGLILIVEKFITGKYLVKLPKFISHVYVIFLVMVSFVIFNADSMSMALTDIKSLLGMSNLTLISFESIYYLKSYAVLFLMAALGSTPAVKNMVLKIKSSRVSASLAVSEPVFVGAIILIVSAFIIDGSFNPFLYFRF